MERINMLRRNLVYPDRLDLAAMMTGPRAAGGEGAWRSSSAREGWGQTPRQAWEDDAVKTGSGRTRGRMLITTDLRNNDTQPETLRMPGAVPELPFVESGSSSRDSGLGQDSQPDAAARSNELLRRFIEDAERQDARSIEFFATFDSNPSPPPPRRRTNPDVPNRAANLRMKPVSTRRKKNCLTWWDYEKCKLIIDPHGVFYLVWLLLVTMCYCYNAWVIPFRWSFPYQTSGNTPIWLTIDSLCDIIYLIDVAIIKPRVSFLHDGFWVRDPQETRKNYMQKIQFKMDLIALMPLEVMYAYFGTKAVFLRIPRFFKVQTFSELYTNLDRILASPFLVRIGRTLIYIFYLIHLNACAYYKVSTWEGIGSNGWVFNGAGNAYIRCFYFATKTATSIGKNPKPENELEYIFMTFAWLMGVFVFALLIGQIRDIIATATRNQTDYRRLVDETMEYMRRQNLPTDLQRRVTSWFNFSYDQHNSLDENRIMNALPINLMTDVAINVHIQTLSKVTIFQDCGEALLRDLVSKLRPVVFLPGDYIFRVGDVGNEMYIVKMGSLEVLGGFGEGVLLRTLTEGAYFGEICLLGISGNRRTASVRSKGFSNLFKLSKNDLHSALVHHQDAQEILRQRANDVIKYTEDVNKRFMTRHSDDPQPRTNDPDPESETLPPFLEDVPEEPNTEDPAPLTSKNSRKKALKKKKSSLQGSQPKPDCTCETQRRKSMPKSLRGKKKVVTFASSSSGTNLYKMRNCNSEPCLRKNKKCCGKEASE